MFLVTIINSNLTINLQIIFGLLMFVDLISCLGMKHRTGWWLPFDLYSICKWLSSFIQNFPLGASLLKWFKLCLTFLVSCCSRNYPLTLLTKGFFGLNPYPPTRPEIPIIIKLHTFL